MANNEDYLDALTAYSKNPSREIPPVLEQYLNGVAKNGETLFQWQLLKPLIVGKMDQVIEDLRQRLSSENIPERPNVENLRFDVMQARIMDALHKFNGAPFTIQRLCELLIDPKQHYKRSDKFMRGLEKNVLVVSTVDPYGSRSRSDLFCRKVVSESSSKHLVNGVDTNGSPFFPRDSNISSNLPPVPGWVTTSVTTAATRPQNTLAADTSEHKPLRKQPSQDSPVTASSGGVVNSLYADQGEQAPTEEVIEETVVTMETNEAGAVATDGGEAMAEDDDEEEEMGEDTNASSSSSSSEEFSTSESSESPGASTEMTTVSSSSEAETQPWAAIAKEGENKDSASSSVDPYFTEVTESSQNSEKLSAVVPSLVSHDIQANSPSSSEAMSSQVEHSEEDDQADNSEESSSELSSCHSVEQRLLNSDTCDLDTATPENIIAQKDSLCHESDTKESSNVTTSDITESDSRATGGDDVIPSFPTHTECSSAVHVQSHEPSSSSNICSYTETSASSTTDSTSRNVTPLNSAEECDSVAGLERLVDSVEQCQSQTPLTSSVTVSTFLPIAQKTPEKSESLPLSASFDSSIDSEEPQHKKCRVLDEAPELSESSEMEASSSNDTHGDTDLMADTTSDSTSQIPAPSSWDRNSEVQESLDIVSCSEKDADTPSADNSNKEESLSASPPSQLASCGDSQGFDVFVDILNKNDSEDKQTEEVQTQETPDMKTLIPETDNVQEPMEQE